MSAPPVKPPWTYIQWNINPTRFTPEELTVPVLGEWSEEQNEEIEAL